MTKFEQLTTNHLLLMSVHSQIFAGLSNTDRSMLQKHHVEEYMIIQKPYLAHGFSLQELSSKTGINVPTLSALINREYRMNFNDFINQHRVAYFKELLLNEDYHRWTLEALAYKAGFNSRTTFIRAFTKFACCSPSQYLKKLKYN
jgi:AraC-like DNA-binding protein